MFERICILSLFVFRGTMLLRIALTMPARPLLIAAHAVVYLGLASGYGCTGALLFFGF